MKRIVYPAVLLMAGLAVSQAVFFCLVYRSNRLLHEGLAAMETAGYLTVPNADVMAGLTRIAPAFNGALFFTFTTGAGLCITAMAAAWVYKRIFNCTRWFVLFLTTAWAVSLYGVNAGGFSLAATASVVVIPPFAFIASIFTMPGEVPPQGRLATALQIAAILLIALVWFPRTDREVFIEIRDNLLLTSSAGSAVNDFYYKYTLYPAKLFKPPGQRLMVPACTGNIKNRNLQYQIKAELAALDYLPVDRDEACDLFVTTENGRLFLSGRSSGFFKTTLPDFFKSPRSVLENFSQKADNQAGLRMITFFSIFAAFPLTLFILVHGFFAFLLFMIPPLYLRHWAASALCLVIGIGTALPLYFSPDPAVISPTEIQGRLSSDNWRDQRSALKAIAKDSMDPLNFDIGERILFSPHVPVRYWYASALGSSRNKAAADTLRRMIDDPHPNVACAAYSGLGRSGAKKYIGDIKTRIILSDHWYVQWYAYKALRQLGWTQKPSGTTRALLQ
ncbi:MAG: HEAT repeat domain-containing protein [Thermodesulfobacteriota bacterium]